MATWKDRAERSRRFWPRSGAGDVTSTSLVLVGVPVIALGLYLCSPSLVVMLALPASFFVFRLGGAGGGNNLSISDAVLLVATFAALPLLRWSGARELKRLFALLVVYQASTLFSVVDHANRYDIVEWFHQLFLVGGSAIVGYVIVERGRARLALSSYLVIATGLSTFTVARIRRARPPSTALAAAGVPEELPRHPLRRRGAHRPVQARMVGAPRPVGAGGQVHVPGRRHLRAVPAVDDRHGGRHLVVYLRRRGVGKRSKLLVASLVPVAAVAYVTTRGQATNGSNFNSVAVRETWLHQSLVLWQRFPFFGVGERFWYTGTYGIVIQPPNAEVSMLATGGVIGLLGLPRAGARGALPPVEASGRSRDHGLRRAAGPCGRGPVRHLLGVADRVHAVDHRRYGTGGGIGDVAPRARGATGPSRRGRPEVPDDAEFTPPPVPARGHPTWRS